MVRRYHVDDSYDDLRNNLRVPFFLFSGLSPYRKLIYYGHLFKKKKNLSLISVFHVTKPFNRPQVVDWTHTTTREENNEILIEKREMISICGSRDLLFCK